FLTGVTAWRCRLLVFQGPRAHRDLHSFPTRRSSDLEVTNPMGFYSRMKLDYPVSLGDYRCAHDPQEPIALHLVHAPIEAGAADQDRKSTRLNSSHVKISYAVFCLKKKSKQVTSSPSI